MIMNIRRMVKPFLFWVVSVAAVYLGVDHWAMAPPLDRQDSIICIK